MSYIAVGRDAPAVQTPEQIAARQRARTALLPQTDAQKAADAARRQAFLVSAEGQRRVAETDAKRQVKQDVETDSALPQDGASGGSSTTKYLLIGGVALAAGWFFFLRKK